MIPDNRGEAGEQKTADRLGNPILQGRIALFS